MDDIDKVKKIDDLTDEDLFRTQEMAFCAEKAIRKLIRKRCNNESVTYTESMQGIRVEQGDKLKIWISRNIGVGHLALEIEKPEEPGEFGKANGRTKSYSFGFMPLQGGIRTLTTGVQGYVVTPDPSLNRNIYAVHKELLEGKDYASMKKSPLLLGMYLLESPRDEQLIKDLNDLFIGDSTEEFFKDKALKQKYGLSLGYKQEKRYTVLKVNCVSFMQSLILKQCEFADDPRSCNENILNCDIFYYLIIQFLKIIPFKQLLKRFDGIIQTFFPKSLRLPPVVRNIFSWFKGLSNSKKREFYYFTQVPVLCSSTLHNIGCASDIVPFDIERIPLCSIESLIPPSALDEALVREEVIGEDDDSEFEDAEEDLFEDAEGSMGGKKRKTLKRHRKRSTPTQRRRRGRAQRDPKHK
jgi:hypothetical protein